MELPSIMKNLISIFYIKSVIQFLTLPKERNIQYQYFCQYFLKKSTNFYSFTPLSFGKAKLIIYTQCYKIYFIPDNIFRYESHYGEKYPLKPYPITKILQMKLYHLINMYPEFICRHTFNNAYDLYYTFAVFLNLNPKLTQENYCDLLDTLISIEENQIKVDVRDYDTVSKLTLVGGNSYDLEVLYIFDNALSLVISPKIAELSKEFASNKASSSKLQFKVKHWSRSA